MERQYSNIEDIITDEGFQAWYWSTPTAAAAQWHRSIVADPALAALAAEAKVYLEAIHIKEKTIPATQVAVAEERLMATLNTLPQETTAPVITMGRRNRKWWWAAAAVLILATAGVWKYSQRTALPQLLATTFGEIREQQLPDGSKVMLNANSEISYHKGWKDGTTREIWLKGEAFFHVAKTPSKARFIVHTEKFDVIVTGTQFNVVNRAGKMNVMLTEGSVILKTCEGKEVYMKPGDYVEVTDKKPELTTAIEDNVLAWKEKKLFFEKTPIATAAQMIEELYGIKVTLANQKLAQKTVSGIMSNDNLDVLLQALEATNDFRIVRKNNEILITE